MSTPRTIKLAARLEAKGGRRVRGVAYTGAIIVQAFGQVVVDLQTVQLPARVPLLLDHENKTAAVAGFLIPRVQGGQIVVEGALADTEAGDMVDAILKSGAPLQLSIGGASPTIEDAPTNGARVNGIDVRPPVLIARAMTIDEISALPLGADASTTLIAAGRGKRTTTEGQRMTFEQYLQSIGIGDSTKIEAAQLDSMRARFEAAHPAGQGEREQPSAEAELTRIKAIKSACAGIDDGEALASEAIRANWTAEATSRIALERVRAARPDTGHAMHSNGRGGAAGQKVIEAGLAIRLGYAEAAEKRYGAAACNAANDQGIHRMSLIGLAEHALRANGHEVPNSRGGVIRAAMRVQASGFSTVSLPTALSNVVGLSAVTAYEGAPASWRPFAAMRSAPDFHEQTAVRPHSTGELEAVAPTGEITHSSLGEESLLRWVLDTYAKVLRVTRKDMINDNAGVLVEGIADMGRRSASKVSDIVFNLWRANAGSHFGSGNSNYFDGATTNLSLASLTTAIQMMRKMVDSLGRPISMTPKYLLVPPELEATARQLLNSINLVGSTTANTLMPEGNPWAGMLSLIVEPRLSNSTLSGYSTTAWYLVADAQDMPILVGGLNTTNPTPVVESFDLGAEVDVLAYASRVTFDFGAALGDPRAAIMSKGAA